MPPTPLFDYKSLDLDQVEFDREVIGQVNPQSFEMAQLDVIVWYSLEKMQALGYKDVAHDEFWIRGHIPGRPIMPGVLMVEAAAQLCSFFMKHIYGLKGFIGFSGIDETKFRETVVPGDRLYLLGYVHKVRSRQFCAKVQGIVNDKIVFDTIISGMKV